jgi:hypothetical protein
MHPAMVLTGGTRPEHVPGAYPDAESCRGVTLSRYVGDADGREIPVIDGCCYLVRTRTMSLRGWYDSRHSTASTMRFKGLSVDEWFTVLERDIRDIERA